MRTRVPTFLACVLSGLLVAGCGDSLLHDDYLVDAVPARALGGIPYYHTLPPPPTWQAVPDDLSPSEVNLGRHGYRIVPFEGVALWRGPQAFRYLALPGLLQVSVSPERIRLTRSTDAYVIDLRSAEPTVVPAAAPTYPVRYSTMASRLFAEAGVRGTKYYVQCPDPDSILAGFRFAYLNDPPCLID